LRHAMRTGPSDTIRRLAWWRRQDDHRSPPGPDPDTSGNPFHRSLERALEIAQQIGSATYCDSGRQTWISSARSYCRVCVASFRLLLERRSRRWPHYLPRQLVPPLPLIRDRPQHGGGQDNSKLSLDRGSCISKTLEGGPSTGSSASGAGYL